MKKVGYDWGSFTGITLNKDQDSDRIIEELKSNSCTVCYYISDQYPLHKKIIKTTNTCEKSL
jgi:Lrp/AsnC family transcriptional regulator for asnA, asnC and gidA